MAERETAPGSVTDPALQETPEGQALLVAVRDVDSADTLVALTPQRSVWRYDFGWDDWLPSSERVDIFVARVALWGHDDIAPTFVCRSAAGRALAAHLDLDLVEEASDVHGSFFSGADAIVFERHLPDRVASRMRALTPRAESAWHDVVAGA
jgi:hypothetical protein